MTPVATLRPVLTEDAGPIVIRGIGAGALPIAPLDLEPSPGDDDG